MASLPLERRTNRLAYKRESLGASGRRTLNRAQRSQRRLLRLGQSPDPGDIESLVGSVTPQCLHLLAALEVPQGDGPVIPATGQPAPIGAPGHAYLGLYRGKAKRTRTISPLYLCVQVSSAAN